jgi:hypothetical protein
MNRKNKKPSASRRCSHTTARGQPCRAWALRDSDPPTCSTHARRPFEAGPDGARTAGAPPGNQNSVTHGFYANALSRQEVADVMKTLGLPTLEPEIACARVALRRVFAFLNNPAELSAREQARLVSIAFNGARTVARLLREHYAIVGKPPTELAQAINEALDSLSEEWDIPL